MEKPNTRHQHRSVRTLRGGSTGRSPSLQEIIGWQYGAVLTGLTFRLRDDIWTAIIKVDIGNRAMVAFVDVGTFARTVEVCNEYAAKGLLSFLPDKFPPKTRSLRRRS